MRLDLPWIVSLSRRGIKINQLFRCIRSLAKSYRRFGL
uniref:Uncharacterized protein n=1 Tax=Setaria italica TaxID=4555 RepID=K3XTT6_SETIT